MRIEIHVLQNFAPSNLNRDDTGSPKDAEFGGCRRGRISSQCIKRAVRWHPALSESLAETFARRSNMHARQVAQILVDKLHKPFEEAFSVARFIFQKMGFKQKAEKLTVMLLLGPDEVTQIADVAAENWDLLSPLSNENLLREELAKKVETYLADFGEDAQMLAHLIVNYRAGSANAATLHQWLELPQERWLDAIEAMRTMSPEFMAELREKYVPGETADEENEEEDTFVPEAAAKLFKAPRKNREVCDKLKAIDVRAEATRAEAGTDSAGKELNAKLKRIVAPLKKLTTNAVDVALFGRMVAEIKDGAMGVDAACQVAHAISTNRVAMETDYFTAVEELKDLAKSQGAGQDAGAGMIGTVDFNSACFYRYANLDLDQLRKNLKDGDNRVDKILVRDTTKAFLEAFIHAVPTGKQNSFAAHNPPSLIFALVRSGAPVSLANAFVKPVSPHGDDSLLDRAIAALDRYQGQVQKMYPKLYGDSGLTKSAFCNLENNKVTNLGEDAGSVDNLIKTIVGAAFNDKEVK